MSTDNHTVALLERKWSSCKYKEEYAEQLQEHLSKGLSFQSFNVPGGVSYNTLINWTKRFPAFAQAREIGEKARLQMLEEEGIKMVKSGNVVAWKHLMQQQQMGEKDPNAVDSTPSGESPHMQVPASIRYVRLQKLKELHQKVKLEQERVEAIEAEVVESDEELDVL